MELKVKVININSDKAYNILKKCGILRKYSQFIDTVRKYSSEKEAIKKAIKVGRFMEKLRDAELKKILTELAYMLQEVYHDKLKAVILYGSVARGMFFQL